MNDIVDLAEVVKGLKQNKKYLTDLFSSDGIEAGILYLFDDQEDIQTLHQTDEVYLVLEGGGYIDINEKRRRITKDSVIFVPSNTKHKFIRDRQDLIVLYFLGG
jgi:mannose-6-phosphate isomerase-like protein (cupin superfamily)